MARILLITLGTSPMIVPEAMLGYGTDFDEVHVISTDNDLLPSIAAQLREIAQSHFPGKVFSLSVVKDMPVPDTARFVKLFEEALLQWYILKAGKEQPYVCISGGSKTIPSIMQKAAGYFGAADVFHIIPLKTKSIPNDIHGVMEAIQTGSLNFIKMGPQAGWAHFRELTGPSLFYPSEQASYPGVHYILANETQFPVTENISHVMQEVRAHATGNEQLTVPFGLLRLLPRELFNSLQKPVNPEDDASWLHALPKTDLHCHLGGFATRGELLNQVRAAADNPAVLPPVIPVEEPPQWPVPATPTPLHAYMQLGDNNGTRLLHDPGCLREQVRLLYAHFREQGLLYAEVRCSPDNYTTPARSAWQVLRDIRDHFQQCMDAARQDDPGRYCHVNLLVIATRKQEGDLSSISRHLALAVTAAQERQPLDTCCRVVGVDLAGYEDKSTRPAYFANDFIGVHRSGLAVTAHAGENDDAESVWQAVHQLHARRIGHALQLYQAPDLVRTMADRRIGVEMCPYANYQIRGFEPMPDKERYQLKHYLDQGIPVTVNTDNIGISAAGITDNFLLLGHMLPELTRLDVLQLIRNGVETAFWNTAAKRKLLSRMEQLVFSACLHHLYP